MTEELNQTIRTLERVLNELDTIKVEDHTIYKTESVGYTAYFNDHLDEVQYQIKLLINETQYQNKILDLEESL